MSDFKFKDIRVEKYREYIYLVDGKSVAFRIDNPLLVAVTKSSIKGYSHRVVAEQENGARKSFYIQSGWVAVTWENKDKDTDDFLF